MGASPSTFSSVPRSCPAALVTTLLALATLAACERTPPPSPPLALGKISVVTPTTPAEQTYTTRGRVEGLPASGRLYFEIHHEEIPEFVGKDGTVTGMHEMIMDMPSFSPEAAQQLQSLQIGDVVAMTFEVRYASDPRSLVTRLEKLAQETPLKLGKVERGG